MKFKLGSECDAKCLMEKDGGQFCVPSVVHNA
jgi:hypothetical protein